MSGYPPENNVNLPMGLLGLFFVYRHLPDFRAEHTDPLDWVGLVLFGSGVALLSYVLEIFGEHTMTKGQIGGLVTVAVIGLEALAFGLCRRFSSRA
jgi:hypothetical protein